MYDVYYTTGGGPWVNAGTDTWVNLWMELIAPKLDVKPILLLHRNKPKGHEDYEFPIETYWHGEDIQKFEEWDGDGSGFGSSNWKPVAPGSTAGTSPQDSAKLFIQKESKMNEGDFDEGFDNETPF